MNNYDIHARIGAQEQAIQLAQLQYQRSMAEDDGLAWYQRSGELGDMLQGLGELQLARTAYRQAHEVSCVLVKHFGTIKTKRRLAHSCNNMGGICRMLNDLAQAKQYYQLGMECCQEIIQTEKESRAFEWQSYYMMQERMGEIYQIEGRYDEAEACFKRSIALCRDLVLEYNQLSDRGNLAAFYQVLGHLYQELDNQKKAKLYFQQCAEQRELLLQENWQSTGLDIPILLAEVLEILGRMCQYENNYPQAEEYQRRGTALRQQRFMDTRSPEDAWEFANMLETLGISIQMDGRPEESLNYLHQCLDLRMQLFQMQNSERNYDALGLVYYNLAMGSTGEDRRKYTQLAYTVWENLRQANPNTDIYTRRLATVVRDLLPHLDEG